MRRIGADSLAAGAPGAPQAQQADPERELEQNAGSDEHGDALAPAREVADDGADQAQRRDELAFVAAFHGIRYTTPLRFGRRLLAAIYSGGSSLRSRD